jgi:hypothetical protein
VGTPDLYPFSKFQTAKSAYTIRFFAPALSGSPPDPGPPSDMKTLSDWRRSASRLGPAMLALAARGRPAAPDGHAPRALPPTKRGRGKHTSYPHHTCSDIRQEQVHFEYPRLKTWRQPRVGHRLHPNTGRSVSREPALLPQRADRTNGRRGLRWQHPSPPEADATYGAQYYTDCHDRQR